MKYLLKNLLIVFLVFLTIAGLFTLVSQPNEKPKEITLNQLVSQINQEEVTKIIIKGDQLAIELKDGLQEKATKEKEASLTESLKNYGLDPEKLKLVDLEIKNESGLAFWLGTILPSFLPLLIIGFFFWFIYRNAQRGQMQAFTFGRSRARLFSPKDEKNRVTFKDVAGLKEAKEELEEIVEFLKNPKKFVNLGAKIPKGVLLVGPPGTGKCITGNSFVTTNKGLIKIQDIPKYFNVHQNGKIDGCEILTVNLKNLQAETKSPSHWFDLGNQRTIKITSQLGITLEGTPEHPVVVLDKETGDFKFKRLDCIQKNDLLVVNYNHQVFGNYQILPDEKTAYLLGLLIGDGGLSIKDKIYFSTNDRELIKFVKNYFQKYFKSTLKKSPSRKYDWYIANWQIKEKLREYGISDSWARGKTIPESILLGPKKYQTAFLRGLFDTDGSCYSKHSSIQLSSSSEKLIQQISILLLNLGIINRIYQRKKKYNNQLQFYLEITADSIENFSKEINFGVLKKKKQLEKILTKKRNTNTNLVPYQQQRLKKLWKKLKEAKTYSRSFYRQNVYKNLNRYLQKDRALSKQSLDKILEFLKKELPSLTKLPEYKYLQELGDNRFFFTSVKKIEKNQQARVYDFTVPELHSFVANGFINHNTLLARAIASEAGVPFFSVSGSEFVEMFVGVGSSVSKDTPVLIKTKDYTKLMPISEFVDKYYPKNKQGYVVPVNGVKTLGFIPQKTKFWGVQGKSSKKFFGNSQWQNIKGVFRHRVNEIYEIHYLGGVIKTTGDHSIFVRDRNFITAKKVQDLKPGEILVNLPFKVRSKFVPGLGTTYKVKSHRFSFSKLKDLILWQNDPEILKNYRLAVTNPDNLYQYQLASLANVSQSTIGLWQRGLAYPRLLSKKVFKSRNKLPQKISITPDLFRLLGYYTAEGRTTKHYTEFVFGAHENKLHQDCIELVKKIFNLQPSSLEFTPDNSVRINYSSSTLAEFFKNQCGNGSHNKHIPELLWDLPKKYFLNYLEGYFKGDGYTTQEAKLCASSVSQQLIREINWLCSMHGIKVGTGENSYKSGRIIKNKPLPGGKYWTLIIGKTAHPFSQENVNSPNQYKKPRIKQIIKKPYNGYVYDLCGCENEAFFGGEKPVLLHNSRVRDLFQTAKKHAPALIFIDELDAIGRQRGAGLGGGHDEREQTLNQILVEMDGFDPNIGIILISATNRPDVLDPALLRPGRFDRRIILDLPDLKDRENILKIHAKDKPLEDKVNLKEIAERTPGFSGADLANLVNEAAILAARRNKKKISQDELRECIEKVLLGPERKSHVLSKKEKEIAAYHESGHALVAASLTHTDPVQKVSIIARGPAAGYTLKLPVKDRHLHTRSEFIDELAVLLGGYAAEELVFGELTTGASSDLLKATELARDLVTKYGMSEKLGPMTFGGREEMVFLGREIATEKNYSEEVAAQIDKEVAKFIENAHQTAKKILTEKRKRLDLLAKQLIKKETIERKEFQRLMRQKV